MGCRCRACRSPGRWKRDRASPRAGQPARSRWGPADTATGAAPGAEGQQLPRGHRNPRREGSKGPPKLIQPKPCGGQGHLETRDPPVPPGAAARAGGTAAAGGWRFGAGALRNRAAEAALEGTAGLETLPHSIPAGKGGSRGSRHPQRFQGSSRHGSAATAPRRAVPRRSRARSSPRRRQM